MNPPIHPAEYAGCAKADFLTVENTCFNTLRLIIHIPKTSDQFRLSAPPPDCPMLPAMPVNFPRFPGGMEGDHPSRQEAAESVKPIKNCLCKLWVTICHNQSFSTAKNVA